METTTNEIFEQHEIQEVRIVAGITADDVETFLNMAAASGLFSSDAMMTAEDMAWDSAYGDGNESHSFLKAVINDSGSEKAIAFICFGPIPYWPGNYEMYAIVVEPQFQRLGIGTALVSEMFRQTTVETGNRVYLETGTEKKFENARRFYEANDFIQQNRYIKQFTPNDGGVVYCYDITSDTIGEQPQ
ncbi:GNAT family N-acetyltransferase [Pseudodesulfovibrio sp. zrk46]|nr:GNAT family N-acetyltransferase [Pseudodesulfovibrio sp. zrk46]